MVCVSVEISEGVLKWYGSWARLSNPPPGRRLRRLARTRGVLASELGREPTDEELAGTLGWTEEEARFAMSVSPDATSLNRPVSADEGASGVGELVADEEASRVAEEVEEEAEMTLHFEALGRLPARVRHVLVRRYDLDGDEPSSLRELAEELGISRERVRQLQHEAERRLRRPRLSDPHPSADARPPRFAATPQRPGKGFSR